MGYGQQGGGGYQRQGGYQQQGGGYAKTQYNPPQKKPFDVTTECEKYADIYVDLTSILQAKGVELEQVKDYLGGWVSGIKISMDRS